MRHLSRPKKLAKKLKKSNASENLRSVENLHRELSVLSRPMTRRHAISTGGKIAAAVVVTAAAVGVGAYAYVSSTSQTSTTTSISTVTTTPTINPASLATEKPGANFLIGNISIALSLEVSTIFDNGAKQAAAGLGLSYSTIDSGAGDAASAVSAARELDFPGRKGDTQLRH